MKLASTGSYNGSYVIRLGGAVNFGSVSAPSSTSSSIGGSSVDCLPKSGTLSFTMSNGTVREIDLDSVQKVSRKP